MTIDVGTKHALLPTEERLLSILRWIELAVPVESRWYPVFRRYVDQIAHRVRFMGGDPTAGRADAGRQLAAPRLAARRPHGRGRRPDERRVAFEGKVRSLTYDRFGDFAGFVLDTEDGERRFASTERAVERVVLRAFAHRVPVARGRRTRRRAPAGVDPASRRLRHGLKTQTGRVPGWWARSVVDVEAGASRCEAFHCVQSAALSALEQAVVGERNADAFGRPLLRYVHVIGGVSATDGVVATRRLARRTHSCVGSRTIGTRPLRRGRRRAERRLSGALPDRSNPILKPS